MMRRQLELVTNRMTDAAATASQRFVPQPFRGMLDRTLVDLACATNGGLAPVAARLRVDVPALDAWRSLGVPTEFRGPLAALAMRAPHPTLPGRCLAA